MQLSCSVHEDWEKHDSPYGSGLHGGSTNRNRQCSGNGISSWRWLSGWCKYIQTKIKCYYSTINQPATHYLKSRDIHDLTITSRDHCLAKLTFFCVDLNPRGTSILDSGALCGQKRYCFHHLQYNVAGGIRICLSVCLSLPLKCLIVTWLLCQSVQPWV